MYENDNEDEKTTRSYEGFEKQTKAYPEDLIALIPNS